MPPSADGAIEIHGGNRIAAARRLGCAPSRLLDASASLVPFGPPAGLRRLLRRALDGAAASPLRDYPERGYASLRAALAAHHGLPADGVLPGNGAADLFTWAARDAAAAGLNLLPAPGFADYGRALACWGGRSAPQRLPLRWDDRFPTPFPDPPAGDVLWLCNPHNPTGQLWSRASLEPLLGRFALVIADEAFLPLVPGGEAQSLVPLLARHRNLVVIRSLTKLFAIAGLRLGYALASPERLARWAAWRDPWPVNGLAALAGEALLGDGAAYARWSARVERWVAWEGTWLRQRLAELPDLAPMPSATNFLLVRGERQGRPLDLEPLRRSLEEDHRILLRDCRSFNGLGSGWLRIALLDRPSHRRLLRALAHQVGRRPLAT
ncbi:aminotransferase class I/II-fold pyridoxal phosphate-dependent enzyme [Cyanobium sp. FGCU-6]|nr:aminotransferase class I/II-fold pyridoxal phosphate-dependent enzyme [Cyanobium sp. FGCU6]